MGFARPGRVVTLATLGTLLFVGSAHGQTARAAATCSDYSNQADAQRAGDTRDADGDGIYCEALPCPCLRPGGDGGGGGDGAPRPSEPRRRAQRISARIISVVDGDTLKVRAYRARRTRYTVRLIGIDTPETRKPGTPVECGGPEATASMRALARRGARVILKTDPTQDTTDRYGRLLAYVYRGRRQLNVTQVSKGWSSAYVYRGKRFQQYSRFERAERSARRADRGVWGLCGGDFHRAGGSSAASGDDGARAVGAACDSIRLGGRYYVLYRDGVSCRFAKGWVRRLYGTRGRKRPRGFRCSTGSGFRSGAYCADRRRGRLFGWHPYD